jgi:hypothetical protein
MNYEPYQGGPVSKILCSPSEDMRDLRLALRSDVNNVGGQRWGPEDVTERLGFVVDPGCWGRISPFGP